LTVVYLQLLTASRPSKSPFERRRYFSSRFYYLTLLDKMLGKSTGLRIVRLGVIGRRIISGWVSFLEQLEKSQDHLAILNDQCHRALKSTGPIFFLLGARVPIEYENRSLSELYAKHGLQNNFARKWAANALVEEGFSQDSVLAYIGHLIGDDHAYQGGATIRGKEVRQMSEFLEQRASQLITPTDFDNEG